ncbi:hypothetical protein FIL88_16280 [Aliiroseovarius halocynthiae]|uniref:Uncharacterized protein n=1 Tax=Aliiroseovarius halocynthiae TaxID=985055 RepID=A0A545SL32_9RHOB|nr:hypothetical protein FIL88_16280 [Aliiroseovarius halocynthiae]
MVFQDFPNIADISFGFQALENRIPHVIREQRPQLGAKTVTQPIVQLCDDEKIVPTIHMLVPTSNDGHGIGFSMDHVNCSAWSLGTAFHVSFGLGLHHSVRLFPA